MENKISLILFTILFYNISFAQTKYTTIPDPNFERALSAFDDVPEDGQVPTINIAELKELVVPSINIKNFTGLEAFGALEILACNFNNAIALDISKNTKLKQLDCIGLELETLDISKNIDLEKLDCRGNNLSELNLSLNTSLRSVFCNDNRLTALDVSNNPLLEILHFDENQIQEINISKNIRLKELGSSKNPLNGLDISKNLELLRLACVSNKLKELDISNNKKLLLVACQENELEVLDLSNNTELKGIICSFNNLTRINARFSFVFKLTNLLASNNPSLTCILVNDVNAADKKEGIYRLWLKDETATYSEDCNTLNINDILDNSAITIYPNPSSGIFTITGDKAISKIEAFSSNGARIKTPVFQNKKTKKINISSFPKGFYFLKVYGQKSTVTKKISIR